MRRPPNSCVGASSALRGLGLLRLSLLVGEGHAGQVGEVLYFLYTFVRGKLSPIFFLFFRWVYSHWTLLPFLVILLLELWCASYDFARENASFFFRFSSCHSRLRFGFIFRLNPSLNGRCSIFRDQSHV